MTTAYAQRGAGAIEFIIISLVFLALITGLIEITRVYRTKFTLNTAIFEAARAGSMHHALIEPINAELANGMATLYLHGQRTLPAIEASMIRARAMGSLPGIGATIVSPTREAFDQLQRQQWIRRNDENEYRWQNVIPNDNLRFRPRQVANITANGVAGEVNLPDANLLKVSSLWCHRLVVPALDRVVFEILNLPLFVSDRQLVCSAISGVSVPGVAEGFYIPVAGDAIVRMQSAVVADDLQ